MRDAMGRSSSLSIFANGFDLAKSRKPKPGKTSKPQRMCSPGARLRARDRHRHHRTRKPDFKAGRVFPLRIFPEWLRMYAKEVAASCEVPVSVVGFGILGMLSACCGMHIKIAIKNRYAPFCHDWLFLIAKVSLGKSPIFSHLQAPLRQIEQTLKDVIADGDEAKSIRCMINDATPEAMNLAQSQNGGAVALVSPETPLLSQMASTARPIPLQPYLS